MTKQSDIEMVAKARAWAIKAHAGQKDKAGKDYFKAHVAAVADGVKGDSIAEAVAFLHDTVEDTSVTMADIRTGFPKEVADAVSALTHSKGISYAEYLWYIQQNPIAVKMADALGKLHSYEGISASEAIARIAAWKPDMH